MHVPDPELEPEAVPLPASTTHVKPTYAALWLGGTMEGALKLLLCLKSPHSIRGAGKLLAKITFKAALESVAQLMNHNDEYLVVSFDSLTSDKIM